MSGTSLLIDTNIILYTLAGRDELATYVEGRQVFVSFISEIEALSYPGLTESERRKVKAYLSRCIVIGLIEGVKEETVRMRSTYRLKLPDAMIAATALRLGVAVLTADKDFDRLKHELTIDIFEC